MLNGVASDSAVNARIRSRAFARKDTDGTFAIGRGARSGGRFSIGAGRSDEMKVPERAFPAI
jgi:hypothetical protein